MKALPILLFASLLLAGCGGSNPKVDSPNVTYRGDTLVVNTTELGKDIVGYKSQVPIEVYVVKGKIVDFAPLENQETRGYMNRALSKLKPVYVGKTIKAAAGQKVDAVSSCTFTSEAIIQNMNLALSEINK